MSKAFTKEDSSDSDDSPELGAEAALKGIPAGSKNYITPRGAGLLKNELKNLLYEERPALVKTVSWAASNGDRSENGDYIYGKRRLREIDRRIRFLTKRLEAAEIVDPKTQKAKKILFGATVEIENEEGIRKKYQIVGIDEAKPGEGLISWISPLAKVLLNQSEGDCVQFKSPKNPDEGEELEIIRVEYL